MIIFGLIKREPGQNWIQAFPFIFSHLKACAFMWKKVYRNSPAGRCCKLPQIVSSLLQISKIQKKSAFLKYLILECFSWLYQLLVYQISWCCSLKKSCGNLKQNQVWAQISTFSPQKWKFCIKEKVFYLKRIFSCLEKRICHLPNESES